MFKSLLKIWTESSFFREVTEEFLSMLESSEKMLGYTFKTLTHKGKGKKVEEKIYIRDQDINFTEKRIRERVLIHLAANPTGNLSACLALISVAKDAERLGDYIKNVYELRNRLEDSEIEGQLFTRLFEDIGDDLLSLFSIVAGAFRESDRVRAQEAIKKGSEIAVRCETFIDDVINTDYSKRQTVVLALGARFMKRIAAHLSNIASSVVNPLPDIDFRVDTIG